DFETLLRQSDFVTFHTPLTAETRHLLGESDIERMKPSAVVINTSRGAVVDTTALARALHAGRLAGAGIDVFEQEPLRPAHPLWTAPNTILTPHVAWYSEEATQTLKRRVAEEVARVAALVANAAPLRLAHVGEPMQVLTEGLREVHVTDEDATSCGLAGVTLARDAWVVSSRLLNEDSASFESVTVRGEKSPVAVVAYDEERLKVPLVLYIDIVGKGKITHVYGGGSFPSLCE